MSAYTPTDEPPLRAELFSVAQLERHARTMAGWHELAPSRRSRPSPLMARLADNEASLREAYALITQAVSRGRQITPAAEWFIDNHQLIEEQIRLTRKHLPRGYQRELPRLANAKLPGTPRVYDLALELISHAHGRVDDAALRAFVSAYQTIQPLRLGELWAIPIMLRLALVENLRRVVAGVTTGRTDRERAATWVAKMVEVAAAEPTRVVVVLAELVKDDPPLSDSFVAELASRLQGQGAALQFPLTWLEQRLAEHGRSIEQALELVTQSQSADQVAISNSVGSLRFLAATDWREFVEAMSVVEQALRRDPCYREMDFATRDRYRHVVEAVARRRDVPELDIAREAVELTHGAQGREAHVGYYLIDDGVAQLGGTRPPRTRLRPAAYAGSIVALTVVTTWLLARFVPVPWPVLGLAATQVALAIVHWAATLIVAPRVLPRLDFSEGIPAAHRTLVAVPTLLTDEAEIDDLVEALEVRFLANRDPNLGFALVTDFRDAPTETLATDAALLARARDRIAALNRRYPDPAQTGGFFLFHRARKWNASEGVWMGWERKRGKLEELDEALRGDLARFATIEGPLERIDRIAYVIVLDSDTMLPSDAARTLAATLAHPLNRPRFDPDTGRVVAGYAILQPRVAVSMASTTRSRFGRLFGGEPGIDPYTRAVSDVYQDLFGEGSFVGKGIHDVDAFRAACGGRFPENHVLSHDLVEGAYARAGLVSDVLLVEDYPATHGADVARRTRWTRGDWQLLGWLRRRVPAFDRRIPNPISRLSQWKILDNLRRSLVPVALLAVLVIGWWRGVGLATTLGVAAIVMVPGLLAALGALFRRPPEQPWLRHRREVATNLVRQLGRDAFLIASLPAEAMWALDAIGRALVRTLVTRKRLLEWRTARDAHRSARPGLRGAFASMGIGVALAIVLAIVLDGPARLGAAPVLALWALAPVWSWWLSEPIRPARSELTADDHRFLGKIARRTWRFFEDHVGPADHDLPPDNFQEDPPRGVAHRTSPTNIGLALLANLTAHDFGFIGTAELVARTTRTLATMDQLERYRGHFLNWYDTVTLEPLLPRYVSTVDSGNLAGHLIVLATGLDELADRTVDHARLFAGLRETLAVLTEEAGESPTLRDLLRATPAPADLDERLELIDAAAQTLISALDRKGEPRALGWARAFAAQAQRARAELATTDHAAALRDLAARCRAFAELDYDFLYDRGRHLFAIGYHVGDHRLDASAYDLLASEARLASFVAIAQGKLPAEHWFRLGRSLTTVGGRATLLSWSGSMFEYLMPMLVMPSYPGTLLDETHQASVARQIAYGRERDVPWGISESGYNKTDAQLNYQYRAFGVPGLGFKRGLGDDLVIAPYASALALMVAPAAATANLRRLARRGDLGDAGFYEAVDFTPARLPPGADHVTITSYMAHHQGMTFLALASALLDRPMQRRFLATPMFQAAELLLQERIPAAQAIEPHPAEVARTLGARDDADHDLRVFTSPSTPTPEVHLLSNGRYHVMVTNAGGGYSRWRDLAVTRWREDATRDCWGTFGYLRDVGTGAFWSAAHQPTLVKGQRYEAIFSPGRAEFRRTDRELETHVEIAVSPEDDIELRRFTLTNRGKAARTIELTTFAEVVLAQAGADLAHPAFSNLFVQTELVRDDHAILCTRRPRSGDERPPWMIHALHLAGADEVSYETSRAAFLGRGRSAIDPIAMHRAKLGDTEGSVLDPIVAIRGAIRLGPEETIKVHVVTGVAETRVEALALLEKYRDPHAADRLLELSWTHNQVVQRRLDVTAAETQLYERLASAVIFSNPAMRAPRSMIARNRGTQAGLWQYGISGDLPIVLVRIADAANLELVRQLVKAHTFWRLKGLVADLVIWNEDPSGYRQVLQDEINGVLAALGDPALIDKPGGVFVRRTEQISTEDRVLMQTVARLIVSDTAGTLAEQMDRRPKQELPAPLALNDEATLQRAPAPPPEVQRPDLVAFNGLGGFTHDGREYVITTYRDGGTPAPWSNVLANPWFGSVVTESGGAYTWCENAHSYRLTPWNNDAVSDASGEAIYLRDDDTGRVWSPTPLPAPCASHYISRHGFGYSVFETVETGIESELTTYVAMDAPVKLTVIKLRNRSGKARKLSLTSYVELVLGANRAPNAPHIVTEHDARSGGLFARNAYDSELSGRVAFLDCSEGQRTVTGDRQEFLGRNGTLADPAALGRVKLSNRVGAALDPCMAMQVVVELADGQEKEIAFAFGSGRDHADARTLVGRFRGTGAARGALEEVWRRWSHTLGAVHVETPDPAVNFLANGWLMYQVIAARLWGRSGFYQSGGAFGFRDQLQDAMAVIHAEPSVLRDQLVRAASRQFPEGDVQHWWHPPQGRGVRTHISDDYLWLPYAACRYVATIGDTGVLDEKLPFLEGRQVNVDEESYYDLPVRSEETATLYEHCVRAIKHGLRMGVHGLPLMGSGDWNDGMNLVGEHGKGESVWLAFFLHDVLTRFRAIAKARGDQAFAETCATEARRLRDAIDREAWDGAWYRRAYFDDGTPLGSASSPECQIDSLPQSWAVLTGACDPARARQALEAVDQRLVRRDLGVIQLFDPPFDRSNLKPGYIKGYVPGVRENGGQYTHAAIWAAMAFAEIEPSRAWALFDLINPVRHGATAEAIATYKVEPYVVAADVYTNPQHAGRGGWTWYTGSAAWMYRLLSESLLGLHLEVDRLRVAPRVPAAWPGFDVHYRYRETVFHIHVRNGGPTVRRVTVDGAPQDDLTIPLVDDRRDHTVEVELG